MKILFTFALATSLLQAQTRHDFRRLEEKVEDLEWREVRKEFDARKAARIAEEERLLALPLDEDIKASARPVFARIMANKSLSETSRTDLLRQLLLGLARNQEQRNRRR